jgi:cytochrome bd ubiquinol oxidase subunit I
MDAVLLARIQFAFTVGFHFIFPTLTVGFAWLLVVLEGIAWRRDDAQLERVARFFGKVFALTFVVGVATGLTMAFQFGTNWAEYSKFVGDIFGAPLAAEGVFAFFLESSFLGLYLFGRGRVPRWVHWFAILMVAVGATISSFWILVANSWQQTPAGFEMTVDALGNQRAVLTDFWAAVFNPSTMIRFFHTMAALFTAGAFFMAGIAAYLIRRGRTEPGIQTALRVAVIVGFAASVLTIAPTGHHHAIQVAETQPEKLAALKGHYEGSTHAGLALFGIPVMEPEPHLKMAIRIPGMLSWLVSGDTATFVPGVKDLMAEGREMPPLFITFVAFQLMVILGMLFLGVYGLALFFELRRRLAGNRLILLGLILVSPLPVVATQLGWIAAEVGRQPWIVYGYLKTRDAISQNVVAGEVIFSLLLFGTIYFLLGSLWIYLLVRKVRKGPDLDSPAAETADALTAPAGQEA